MLPVPDAVAAKLPHLPDGPGVYMWKGRDGTTLYIGKAKRLRSRVRSYFAGDLPDSPRNRLLQRLIATAGPGRGDAIDPEQLGDQVVEALVGSHAGTVSPGTDSPAEPHRPMLRGQQRSKGLIPVSTCPIPRGRHSFRQR